MHPTLHPSAAEATAPLVASLSPIQRAYLVGSQDGFELRGPARYYVSCDLDSRLAADTGRLAGLGDRLRRLVRQNALLRVRVGEGLSLTTLPPDAADDVDVDIRSVDDGAFAAADAAVRSSVTADDFSFDGWPQLSVTVVRSPQRARLHLVYALWLMDASSLDAFLAALLGPSAATGTPAGRVPTEGVSARRAARDERFWRAQAADLPDPAELPLRPTWRQAGIAVSHRMATIEAPVARRIAALAAEHGLTPAMTCLAAYGVTLGRLGGGGAHTVTVLHSRRTHPVTSDTLGNHGSAMPLAVPATGEHAFVDLARAVQARYLTQAMHGSLSGAEIARLVDPAADPRRLPYPFAFTALQVDGPGEAALGFCRRWDDVQLRVPQVLIDHQAVMDGDGTWRLGFDWRAEAFDAGFVDDLVEQHVALLHELADAPQRWTRAVTRPQHPVVDPRPPRTDDTLQDRVLRTAAASPDAVAVHDVHRSWSYAELVDRASVVAAALLDAGVQPGEHVAVHLPRGADQVVGILGALLAGGVYVPIAHGTPEGRLDRIARRAELRAAVTAGDPQDDARWRGRGASTVRVPVDRPAARPALPQVDRVPTAYVIFTSGSTGEPKGVVISHAAVLATVDEVNDLLGLRPDDGILSVSSIGFDLSVYDLFGPLLRGASVVMLSEQSARNPAAWVAEIRRHGVTVWNSAPALAALVAEESAPLPSVRAFMLSGDWIPLTLPAALQRLARGADVISLGGATEGAIWSIFHRVADQDRDARSIPYGRPLPRQDILVLDAEGEQCPPWCIGEIVIAGDGVADGYLNDPAKTAAAFSHHPRHGWIYRTGDRGRRHPSGVVEFLGRTDTQVKLNGHRVELGEVEHLLERRADVVRCAACVRGEGRRKALVAFVTLAADAAPSWRDDAFAQLRGALPQYMVPDAVVAIDAIPLTSNGKVDRRRLEAMPVDDLVPEQAPPLDLRDTESQQVAACWQDVLGAAPDGRTLFEAGGSSYDAIRLLSALRNRFGYDVTFGELMADPTVTGLAGRCHQTGRPPSAGIWVAHAPAQVPATLRLVLLPPVGGGASCYAPLTAALGPGVDVHAVALDRPVDGLAALPDLARRCLDHLPAEVWAGDMPVVFAGWSFGGALAVEAARAARVPCARVVVVDTPLTPAARGHGGSEAGWLDGFLRDLRGTGAADVDGDQVAADPVLRTRFEVYRQNLRLLREWQPEPLDVPLVELRATCDPAEPDPHAWQRMAPSRSASSLDGDHFAVFVGDNTERVAAAIEKGDR